MVLQPLKTLHLKSHSKYIGGDNSAHHNTRCLWRDRTDGTAGNKTAKGG